MGRLVKDPDIRYSQGDNPTAIARYTLAVDRRYRRREDEQNADFIGCVAFGKAAEFAEKYLKKGTKIVATGRIQTGTYTRQDGTTAYTTDVILEDQEFAESKGASGGGTGAAPAQAAAPQAAPAQQAAMPTQAAFTANADGFMDIPDGIEDELPFA